MSKQVYISADYDYYNGDQDVVEELVKWGKDDKHKVDFVVVFLIATIAVSVI